MKYGIALGSNLGDRLENLRQAVVALLQSVPGSRVIATSAVYETDPVDCPPGSPGFLNAVIELEAELQPLDLLQHTRAIEAALGRPNEHEHHAPRTVDLDLLYADAAVVDHPDLTLPHPRMTQRRFVLQPLADIRADLRLPGEDRSVQEILDTLPISDEPPPRVYSLDWLDLGSP
ncbi:2-amino-4-hydroxy-6-hydroxymethyldihydropteridine diphosphokinase [Verrucomicrobium spinosum]|uniref:2-amino-4-hydroxy-6- hydroxymethyldihydropteridine diphosphokinase n=1 Tax=Verrucomicrobium spinosum TaxID=2736 RepID=UPI0001745875|nr:2-amino-4-hydroxy-6-hydroxymethyldihydropteridine diphosphokinase [Verrucomicrobium spinosum]